MKTDVCANYKLTNIYNKWFMACKGKLNIRIHSDITGDRVVLGGKKVPGSLSKAVSDVLKKGSEEVKYMQGILT